MNIIDEYQGVGWVDGPETQINAENLNKMDLAIVKLYQKMSEEIQQIKNNRSHVGMIIQSTTLDTMEKVIKEYGGITWELIEEKVLMGASDKYKVGTTGGKTKYTLSAAIGACNGNDTTLGYITDSPSEFQKVNKANYVLGAGNTSTFEMWNHSTLVTEAGVNDRNVTIEPPYFATYMWHRVA